MSISRLFVESVSSDFGMGGIPNLYLSSTIESLENLDKKTDYYGSVRKNAKFAFIPIESIKDVLETISRTTENGEPKDPS